MRRITISDQVRPGARTLRSGNIGKTPDACNSASILPQASCDWTISLPERLSFAEEAKSGRPDLTCRPPCRPDHQADSTGRRNTLDHIEFEQPVECLRRCLPVECLAWPRVQCMGNGAQLVLTVPAKVHAFGEVLAEQTIGVLVAATLPRALRVAEVDVEAGVDPVGIVAKVGR